MSHPAAHVAAVTVDDLGVVVTVVDLDESAWSLADCRAVLDRDELAAGSRLASARLADRFVVRHAALRQILGDHLGVEPAAVRWEVAPGGKPGPAGPDPSGPGVAWNASHSGRVCAVAVASGGPVAGADAGAGGPSGAGRWSGGIGVDLERVAEADPAPEMLDLVLDGRERAALASGPGGAGPGCGAEVSAADRRRRWTRAWTRKEAMAKAVGLGLAAPMADLGVDVGATWAVARWPAGPAWPEPSRCAWADLSPILPGYCLAVMVASD